MYPFRTVDMCVHLRGSMKIHTQSVIGWSAGRPPYLLFLISRSSYFLPICLWIFLRTKEAMQRLKAQRQKEKGDQATPPQPFSPSPRPRVTRVRLQYRLREQEEEEGGTRNGISFYFWSRPPFFEGPLFSRGMVAGFCRSPCCEAKL